MTESEEITREQRIDMQLKSSISGWEIIKWRESLDTEELDAHAVKEFPTASGPVDYSLFVAGRLLGIIEAKKLSVGAENVLEQAKRYSRGVPNTLGD